jgi:ribosomal protein S18 acetylase RimI-like enzyme
MRVSVVDGAVTSELRRSILRPTWPAGASMHGDGEPGAVHLAAQLDDLVVGACVLFARAYPPRPQGPDAWQLRGMATAPEYRGCGIGAAIVEEAVRQVERRRGRLLWCEARESAISFYARHGFVGEGDLFAHAETGIAHQLMYRELSSQDEPSTS